MMSGEGTMVSIELTPEFASKAGGLAIEFPDGIHKITPLVRLSSKGKAFVEIAASKSVSGEIRVLLDGNVVGTKSIVAGEEAERSMQGIRSASLLDSWLFPAEEALPGDGPLAKIEFKYPGSEFTMLPGGGELGVILVFLVASMAFGVAVLKPLNIQI